MSELINTSNRRKDFLRQLLMTASAFALLGVLQAEAEASDSSELPMVWIELGGQMEHSDGFGQIYAPPFLLKTPAPDFESVSPLSIENINPSSYGGDGAIAFRPEGGDWIFSASLRYGRTIGKRHVHDQTATPILRSHTNPGGAPGTRFYTPSLRFADTKAENRETHVVADFKAGRDVGLGLFGSASVSTLGFGVRYAQFGSAVTDKLRGDPDLRYSWPPPKYARLKAYHSYNASARMQRSFHGIGPTISWDNQSRLIGGAPRGEITLDWGANAAILFGRQKALVHHQTHGQYTKFAKYDIQHVYYGLQSEYQHSANHVRSRSVVVPNIGGFAGLSWRSSNAKMSLGYRADFFFGAIDGGVDVARKENRSFYGPFASISVGIGG